MEAPILHRTYLAQVSIGRRNVARIYEAAGRRFVIVAIYPKRKWLYVDIDSPGDDPEQTLIRWQVERYVAQDDLDDVMAPFTPRFYGVFAGYRDPLAPAPPTDRPDQICYFIGSEAGPIKIGIAANPQRRLKGLQTAHHDRLAILATTPGGSDIERDYHARFSDHRLHGEWFARHPDILAEIERLNPSPSQDIGRETV